MPLTLDTFHYVVTQYNNSKFRDANAIIRISNLKSSRNHKHQN